MSAPDEVKPKVIILSKEQIDEIAEQVEDRFYARVGKTVIEKVLWAIGIATTGIVIFLAGKGALPK